MKVLFAVSNEKISSLIVKEYQKQYKEIISYKNVYYFNAILKEIQKDKSYDRIVISEDLEQFTNSNYQQMDKFIFDKLDNISDEAYNTQGENVPIIVLCSERRQKGEDILVKLFGIGVYDAVIGKDRSIDEVCNLIKRPRSKKEAKEYYKIDSESVNYQAENENDVSEVEIQNILAHYRRLGKNEEKYVESFDNIALQYNDIQLKVICKVLPLNVRAVLEEKSTKYQQLIAFNKPISESVRNTGKTKKEPVSGTSEKLLVSPTSKTILSKPVVIPSSIKTDQVKRLTRVTEPERIETKPEVKPEIRNENKIEDDIEALLNEFEKPINEVEEIKEEPKRGRGRPKKNQEEDQVEQPKRGRGRPKKNQEPDIIEEDDDIESILPGFDDEEDEEEISLPGFEEENDAILPGFEDEDEEEEEDEEYEDEDEIEDNNENILPGFDDEEEEQYDEEDEEIEEEEENLEDILNANSQKFIPNSQKEIEPAYIRPESNEQQISRREAYTHVDISSLLTSDKKIATFVGTSKNGTSFILNNVAELLSSQGINVAILDATQNRNSYYIYTKNEEVLRRTAFSSIENLAKGQAKGIKVNNNLTVYTSLPSQREEINEVGPILETLVKNHSLVLIDCDFKTPVEYFENAQEIYLVQSMDVLTIQPLTEFLRDMKAREILTESKIRIIINKYIKLKSVTEKAIIGGMSFYNDPAMSYMTELFDRNVVKYITIPFEQEIYAKYLDGLVNCDISLKGYSKLFMQVLKQLGNSVYPLIAGKSSNRNMNAPRNPGGFTESMNNTLNQMKNNY